MSRYWLGMSALAVTVGIAAVTAAPAEGQAAGIATIQAAARVINKDLAG